MKAKKILNSLVLTIILLSGCAYQHGFVMAPNLTLYESPAIFNNAQYIPILRFCDYYNLDWDWDLISQRIEIKKDTNVVLFRPDSRFALLNNEAIEFDHPIEYRNGEAYIPVQTAVFLTEDAFMLKEQPVPYKKRHQIKTIVIDPGHGGKDPGAVSRYGTREKNIVLDIAKRLKRRFENKGIKVYLTRQKDVFIPLKRRANFANKYGADLFISLHANASRYSRARGFEVYYLSEATDDNARALAAAENASLKFENATMNGQQGTPSEMTTLYDLKLTEYRRQSKGLAYYICNMTSDRLAMKKRGVKGARFAVLKGAMMPSVLVEVGFLSNKREASKLKRSSFRDRVAAAISHSILSYKREYERTNGFSR